MVRGIVIGHSNFAKAIIDTAEQIIGKQPYINVVSNKGFSCDVLCEKIAELINSNKGQDTIIFLDLPGGSCTISCYKLMKDKQDLNIICGVNLPVIIEFFMLRDKYRAKELIPILIKKGRDNITQLRCRDE